MQKGEAQMSRGNIRKGRKKQNVKNNKIFKTCGNCQLGRWYCNFPKDTEGCLNWIPVLKVGNPKREDPERKQKIQNVVFSNILEK